MLGTALSLAFALSSQLAEPASAPSARSGVAESREPAKLAPLDAETSTTTLFVVTSTVWSSVRYAERTPSKPRRFRHALEMEIEGPRTWDLETFYLGLHLEYGYFISKTITQTLQGIQAPGRFPTIDQSVLLMGLGVTAEVRPLPYLGVVPFFTYLFTPRFVSVTVADDNSLKPHFAFAQSFTPGVMARGYIPVSRYLDILVGGGPALYIASLNAHGATSLGLNANAGVQISSAHFPDARLMAYFRYAPLRKDETLELNFTGAGVLGDIVFALF
jgi:hypothetical protein